MIGPEPLFTRLWLRQQEGRDLLTQLPSPPTHMACNVLPQGNERDHKIEDSGATTLLARRQLEFRYFPFHLTIVEQGCNCFNVVGY